MSICNHIWFLAGSLNGLPIEGCGICGVQRGRPDLRQQPERKNMSEPDQGESVLGEKPDGFKVRQKPLPLTAAEREHAATVLLRESRNELKKWSARYAGSDHAKRAVIRTANLISRIDELLLQL
jgi:hypothetical protein